VALLPRRNPAAAASQPARRILEQFDRNGRSSSKGEHTVRLRAHITLALVLAAVAVPAAQADAISRYLANHPQASPTRPDDRSGTLSLSTPSAMPDAIDRYLANHQQPNPTRPDDRSGLRVLATSASTPVAAHATTHSFAWRDAAIGAAGTLALILALAAAARARRLRVAL
jgi:hypothetical protein